MKYLSIKKRFFFIAILFLLINNTVFSEIIAKVNPLAISLEETTVLTLTLDNATNIGSPNLMPLLKDFNILSTERQFSTTNINGRKTSMSRWSIVLKPKHQGEITIAPITIGNEKSQPIHLNVMETNEPENKNNSSYTILKATASEHNPYINQQIIYKIKLLNRQQLFNTQYIPPEIKDALSVQLSPEKGYQTKYKGELYDVEELTYAIFPQKSGTLTIIPPSFSADIYSSFSPSKLNINANKISINVKPLPNGIDINQWLAAKNVTLEESYDKPLSEFTEGDTITRTITLKAVGTIHQLLPKLNFVNTDGFNAYADKALVEDNMENNEIVAQAIYKITYLFTKAKDVNIPAINIPWYNIDTKTNAFVTLPHKTITIKPKKSTQKSINKYFSKQKNHVQTRSPDKPMSINIILVIIIILLLSVIIIFTLYLLNIKAKETKKPAKTSNPSQVNLQKACKNNDPQLARQALLDFAREKWPEHNILNLNDIPIDSVEFKQQMELLLSILYSKNSKNNWQGQTLWNIFTKLNFKKKSPKIRRKALPSMYPK